MTGVTLTVRVAVLLTPPSPSVMTKLTSRGSADGFWETLAKLIAFSTEMYSRGLDKSDELEADRLGVVIAARGGYDAYGLPAVLQTLQAMNAQDSALALMFKTHPAPAERLDTLSEKMQPVLMSSCVQRYLCRTSEVTNS